MLSQSNAQVQTANDYFAYGAALAKEGRYEGAIDQLLFGLALDPANGKGHFYLAELYRRTGKIGEAYDHYSRARPLLSDPVLITQLDNNLRELEPKVLPLKQQREAAEAKLQQLQQTRMAAERQAAETLPKARAMIEVGRPADAITMLKGIVEAAPHLVEAQFLLGEAYTRLGDGASALPYFNAVAERATDPAMRQEAMLKAKGLEAGLARRTALQAPVVSPGSASETPQNKEQQAQAATQFDAAEASLEGGQVEKAHILALTGLRITPDSARGNYILAKILVRERALIQARDAYQMSLNALGLTPKQRDDAEGTLNVIQAELAARPGGTPPASKPAGPPATTQTDVPQPQDAAFQSPVNTAAVLAARGNLQGAITTLRAYLINAPFDTAAQVILARHLKDAGDEAAALAELGQAIAGAPSDADARLLRASILMKRRDFTAAMPDLQNVIDGGNASAITYLNRGVAYQNLRDPARAIADYDRAITMEPTKAVAYINKGSALIQMHQDRPAIEALTIGLQHDPQSVEAFLSRGMAELNVFDLEAAVADFSRVLELSPGHRQALLYRAQAYVSQKAYVGAIADLDRVLAASPGDTEVLTLRGGCYAQMVQHDKAVADYDAVLAIQPNNTDVKSRRDLSAGELARMNAIKPTP